VSIRFDVLTRDGAARASAQVFLTFHINSAGATMTPVIFFAVGGNRRPLPCRYIGQGLEGPRSDLDSDFLAGPAVARLQPFRPQGLEGTMTIWSIS
jgi:hypothetical protein